MSGGQLVQTSALVKRPRICCPVPCPGSFWTSPKRRLHNLSGQRVPVFFWMALWPSGESGTPSPPPPIFMLAANLLGVHSTPSSRLLMKMVNKTGPDIDHWGTLLLASFIMCINRMIQPAITKRKIKSLFPLPSGPPLMAKPSIYKFTAWLTFLCVFYLCGTQGPTTFLYCAFWSSLSLLYQWIRFSV